MQVQVFDPFPHGQAEHSHPRYDSRGEGFCPVAFDGVPVSAASDPLNNYPQGRGVGDAGFPLRERQKW